MIATPRKPTRLALLENLVELRSSTTEFLEQYNGSKLNVSIESQEDQMASGHIRRVSRLYFETVEESILFSVSYMIRKNLTAIEYDLLINDSIPMGRMFILQNRNDVLDKRNVIVSREVDRKIAGELNVASPFLYRKSYDLFIGEREVGKIYEFFNEESLERI
jgi:hypothetical protein